MKEYFYWFGIASFIWVSARLLIVSVKWFRDANRVFQDYNEFRLGIARRVTALERK